MPSFDVVSEVDVHQLTNAVDQATRVVTNRFDFKGVDAGFERTDRVVAIHAEADMQVQQMVDMLRAALIKWDIDPGAMDVGEALQSGRQMKLVVTLRHGLDKDLCRRIVKHIKESKAKVQTSIQGEQVRVTGKKRDELQAVIAGLREGEWGQPLQYSNFRD